MTDGGSTDLEAAIAEARITKTSGVKIIVGAVGDWVNRREVHELASYPDEENVISADYEFLSTIETRIQRAVCNGDPFNSYTCIFFVFIFVDIFVIPCRC